MIFRVDVSLEPGDHDLIEIADGILDALCLSEVQGVSSFDGVDPEGEE